MVSNSTKRRSSCAHGPSFLDLLRIFFLLYWHLAPLEVLLLHSALPLHARVGARRAAYSVAHEETEGVFWSYCDRLPPDKTLWGRGPQGGTRSPRPGGGRDPTPVEPVCDSFFSLPSPGQAVPPSTPSVFGSSEVSGLSNIGPFLEDPVQRRAFWDSTALRLTRDPVIDYY